eukprot:1161922-Pelagomonas_calceolata.AAC.13
MDGGCISSTSMSWAASMSSVPTMVDLKMDGGCISGASMAWAPPAHSTGTKQSYKKAKAFKKQASGVATSIIVGRCLLTALVLLKTMKGKQSPTKPGSAVAYPTIVYISLLTAPVPSDAMKGKQSCTKPGSSFTAYIIICRAAAHSAGI